MKSLFVCKNKFSASKKAMVFLLAFLILFSGGVRSALAIPTEETISVPQTISDTKKSFWDTLLKSLQKAGSVALQRTLSSALNKIAYDTANWIGSGGSGQKPLFVTESWGSYLTNIGDEAAGQFIETFAGRLAMGDEEKSNCDTILSSCNKNCDGLGTTSNNKDQDFANKFTCYQSCADKNTACAAKNAQAAVKSLNVTPSFSVCSPSSLEAKLKIGLGLVDQERPAAPDCTASQMIKSWDTDINKKISDLRDPNFLNTFANIFDPRSNDLGIYMSARSDLANTVSKNTEVSSNQLIANKGWLDVRNIAGMTESAPGSAERQLETALAVENANIGKFTGDALVDASSVFLNQLALSAFNKLLQNLGSKATQANSSHSYSYQSDPNSSYSQDALEKITMTSLQPKFNVLADYNVLSQLVICTDSKNPGPDNCVIDNDFMQAVTENKTVAEAVAAGYLHGDWQFTMDNSGDSYHSSYSLRNISILRKYRILPVGWEEAVKKSAGNGKDPKKVTLNELLACFNSTDWCAGLVDPNWVLKAPLNYCKKQGVGAQIMSKNVMAGTDNSSSSLSILRSEDYCADNETCIKEKGNGKCEAYGYCNEEKRTWNFGNDSCQPINNTCRAFVNADNGQSASYLENTLNYGECNSENSGCRQYSVFGTYASSTGAITWDAAKSIYFNKKLTDCSAGDEGCTELMRVKPTWGSNLVMNANFANDSIGASSTVDKLNDWPIASSGNSYRATIVDAAAETNAGNGTAIKLEANGGAGTSAKVYSDYTNSLVPKNLQIIPGVAYTLSADVYLVDGDNAQLELGPSGNQAVKSTASKNSWQHLSVTTNTNQALSEAVFAVAGYGQNKVTFYIQNIKFEMSDWDTSFSAYGKYTFYEKLIPPYLEKTCYADVTSATKDYSLKNNAPAVCSNYARKCNKEEVGCELFTSALDQFSAPAKATSGDYCPADCVGYDLFISKATYFNLPESENMIPKNATACSAEAVGCNEFTNLDAVNAGGEQKEYYTSLKQCIKPDAAKCSNFYSWSGEGSGYQLKSYSLKKAADGQPAVTSNDSAECNATIFNLPVSDPGYNPDCQEFYTAGGQVYYHLVSKTISCSDDCHAYRLSGTNVDKSIVKEEDCSGTGSNWDGANSVCNVCLNGGTWDATHKACVYQAIPGEGQTCQASQNGCREYNGNRGSNVRLLSSDDFESGLSNWSANCNGEINISAVSNANNGHSLYFNSASAECSGGTGLIGRLPLIKEIIAGSNPTARLNVGNSVSKGSAYNVKFLARAAGNTNLKISFVNKDTGEQTFFSAASPVIVKGGNEWGIYEANLASLDHEVGANEQLVISGNGSFYLDNFILSEITDRYYLLKNSSQVPDVCYYDNSDNYQGADYNLGCSQYTDRGNLTHNLRQFSKLCANSAVGCEQMIDTQNSSKYAAEYWQDGNSTTSCAVGSAGCVAVNGDTAIYAVYDETKLCSSANKGCSRFGQAQGGASITSWGDVYKLNNPDNYNNSLCEQASVGCEEWKNDDNGSVYFKNPGGNACVYRAGKDAANPGKAWYKIPAMRCGGISTGNICSHDSDCSGGVKCTVDNNDYPCSVSYFKTIGLGGAGNQIPVPDKDAGLCDATESGCTEYIDPVSQFSPNLVFNPSYKSTGNNMPNGWGTNSQDRWSNKTLGADQQVIRIEPNRLYSFNTDYTDEGDNTVSLDFQNPVKPLLGDNTFGTSTQKLSIVKGRQPFIFNSLNNRQALVSGGSVQKTIKVVELAVDYQLQSNIDKKSCNGQTKFDNGCVMFNERSISGASGVAALNQDAYRTTDGAIPTTCNSAQAGSCTANQVVKVKPDRVCSKWLDCTTYVTDPETKQKTCYALGECDRLDDKNECAHFTETVAGAHTFAAQYDKNTSGYSLLDKYNLGQMKEVGGIPQDDIAHYDFEGPTTPTVECRADVDFPSKASCTTKKFFISSPDESKNNNGSNSGNPPATDYPAQGTRYLAVPANRQVTPNGNDNPVILNSKDDSQSYYLNYLTNTKNSAGLASKVVITDSDNKVLVDAVTHDRLVFVSSANSGWERKIVKFNPGKGVKKIKIYLTSDTTNVDDKAYMYFDDINIEPVLNIGDDQYAAKECRLYPASDSLTCTSKNSNIIKNGLEGYCLEHDPANPSVCSLWYPIDKISAATDGRSTLGYNGKFPLNYCAAVNGNFDLVEKRKGVFVDDKKLDLDVNVSVNGVDLGSGCNKFDGSNKELGKIACLNSNFASSSDTNYNLWISITTDGYKYVKFLCVPDETKLFNGLKHGVTAAADPGDNSEAVSGHHGDWGKCADQLFSVGWGRYDGLAEIQNTETNVGYNGTAGEKINGLNGGDPIMVADHNQTLSESNLKYIPGGANSDPAKTFRLACDKFVQTVDANGNNKAWTGRFSDTSPYASTTPNYFFYLSNGATGVEKFYNQSPYYLSGYGYNNSANTFGAAIWPDDFDITASGRIHLRDLISSSNQENIFAGRPFGCDDGVAGSKGCNMIGSCSNNPDIFCLAPSVYGDANIFNIQSKTCEGVGTCLPIWSTSSPLSLMNQLPNTAATILRNLFLTSYNAYKFNGINYTPASELKYNDYSNGVAPFSTANCTRRGDGSEAFCAVYPVLTNVKLYYNNNVTPFSTAAKFTINTPGIYRLEFNSQVDVEQQPLKSIEIAWGDGNTQVITGQDEHRITPHVFYHYYSDIGSKDLSIKITDNWGIYKEFK